MVREMEHDDVPYVVRFMKGFEQASKFVTVNEKYAIERYRNLIKSKVGTVLLLIEDLTLKGAFGFIEYPDLHSGLMTSVETFWFMHPEHRGKGLLLFNEWERICDKKRIPQRCMIYMVDSHPEVLKRLYERKGFVLIENHYMKVVKEFIVEV